MDEDNNEFFANFNKFFEMMQHEIARILRDQMENGELGEGSDFLNQGFKVEVGPDGPRFSPISQRDMHNINPNEISWEKPYTDVMVIDDGKKYQIVLEVPGIETEDVQITFTDEKKIMVQAEFDDYKYRKGLLLKFPVDNDSLEYTVRNGVLEIFIKIIE